MQKEKESQGKTIQLENIEPKWTIIFEKMIKEAKNQDLNDRD